MSRIEFLGHATTVIEMDGTRVLTDPVLRRLASGLVHRHAHVFGPPPGSVDAVLISHLHHDHLDLPTLTSLGKGTYIVAPDKGRAVLERRGFNNVVEVEPGARIEIGNVRVHATHAVHVGYRAPFGPLGGSLGFIVEAAHRVYFAGDTATFAEMSSLGPVDVALLPVAGWGPVLGPGHMGPEEAVDALELIRAAVAIPIHWGSLVPLGLHLRTWPYLTQPPNTFRDLARQRLPDVDVRILQPGEAFEF